MQSFLEFNNAENILAELTEQLAEEKIPVQHASDSVAKVLGNKSAVKFMTHLRPGTEKHTSWDKVNTALVNQGVKTPHIAKIASNIKPAQYKEETEKDLPFTPDKPHKPIAKAGKYGSGYSTARKLARMSLEKQRKKAIKEEEDKEQSGKINVDEASKPYWKSPAWQKKMADAAKRERKEREKKEVKEEIEQIEEASDAHKVMVTVSDPNHPAVTQRKEQLMKHVIVRAGDKGEAQAKAESFYKKKGYKVHGSEYHSKQPSTSMKTEGK